MSETQAWLGAATANSRFNRFGATGSLCAESVVTLNLRFCLQRNPSFLRSARTRYSVADTP